MKVLMIQLLLTHSHRDCYGKILAEYL